MISKTTLIFIGVVIAVVIAFVIIILFDNGACWNPSSAEMYVHEHIKLIKEFENLKNTFESGDITQEEFEYDKSIMRDKEIQIFEDVRNNTFSDSERSEYNYFYLNHLKFPSPLE